MSGSTRLTEKFLSIGHGYIGTEMALLSLLFTPSTAVLLLLTPIAFLILRAFYRISPFHPLSHVPGPLLPRVSSLWLVYHAWIGDECTTVHKIHQKYGSTVRTGPNSVDISDGDALNDIYTAKGGFRKTDFYGNFDIDGHKSIFSELMPERRAVRAKAVLPLFSSGSLRAGKDMLGEVVQSFVDLCKEKAAESRASGKVVNLLDLTRGLSIDGVTGYLFGRPYGGVQDARQEDKGVIDGKLIRMSASGMVDAFVGVGRFWYLRSEIFQWVDWLDAKFGAGSSEEGFESIELVDKFVAGIVEDAQKALETEKAASTTSVNGVTVDSYPCRLLSAGISVSETRAQCKDLIFAGTDSTGMNLATIMFHLAKHPEVVKALEEELEQNQGVTDLMEIQALPWLRGVVREGLRVSMANPSRLARVVPAQGWSFKGTKFPAGTEVSCSPFELHLNEDVFKSPLVFNPRRWIDEGSTSQEMDRDSIPFGLGTRQCIARNLATVELFLAVKALVESGVMHGAEVVADKIEIMEWFNSHVVGGKIGMKWT